MDVKRHRTDFIEPLPTGSYRVRVRSKAAPYSAVFKTLPEAVAASERAQAALETACRNQAILRIESRLRARMTVDPQSGCWLFKGPFVESGYGKIRVLGQHFVAHRLSYETFIGLIPNGMLVCHRCDVPACIRPEHLFLGTPQDNMTDMVSKGRARTGPRGPRAKLSLDAADDIRAMHASGATCAEISRKHDVRPNTVRRVVAGRVWARTA